LPASIAAQLQRLYQTVKVDEDLEDNDEEDMEDDTYDDNEDKNIDDDDKSEEKDSAVDDLVAGLQSTHL
jgi:hypothetical protein